MKVAAISDLHGHLPEIPECDLLLIAGDICPVWNHDIDFQRHWLEHVFGPWCKRQPAKQIIGVWGNHDWIGEQCKPLLPWVVLTDELTTVKSAWDIPPNHTVRSGELLVYGLPWQRRYYDWAFNLDEPELDLKYQAIPECDIIISHGPARGYGDRAPRGGKKQGYERVGSRAFTKRIDEIKPKLVVTGHIHNDPGLWRRGSTKICNATIVNERYDHVYAPRLFDL